MRSVGRAALALGALVAFGVTANAQPFTLADALAVAYETNPQLLAQQASLRASDEQVAQANAGWRPTVNAQGSYGVQRFGFTPIHPDPANPALVVNEASAHPVQGQLTVTEPILRGGRTYAEVRRAKALVRAGRAQLTGTEEDVLLAAASSYMDVVRDSAIVQLREANVALLTKQRDSTQIQFNAGALTRTDVAQSEARLAGAQSDLTTAQGQLATSRATYIQTLGRPPETLETSPALPRLPSNEADVVALAMKQNPQLIAAQESERAASFGVDDAYGALLP